MSTFLIGCAVCAALWVLGYALGAPLIVGLLTSSAFGSTAIAAVGGNTVPVYVVMAAILLLVTVSKSSSRARLIQTLAEEPLAWLVCVLVVYGVASAYLLPRIFQDQTTAIIPGALDVIESPLRPVPGNLNQSAYFILGALIFLAAGVLLKQGREAQLRVAFLAWAWINAALGGFELTSKAAGLGDPLVSIRTASYAMLNNDTIGSFWRITGGFPEASVYAVAAMQGLAFALVDWSRTGSGLSSALVAVYAALIIASTSSTAYASALILGLVYAASLIYSVLRNKIRPHHLVSIGILAIGLAALLAVYLYDAFLFDPLVRMIAEVTIEKSSSASAVERSYWNAKGIAAFLETSGFGAGLGSTRSSSWAISVLAQLGVFGAACFAIMIWALFRCVLERGSEGPHLAASASAAALAGLLASSFGGSVADPGPIFFIALAAASHRFSIDGRRRPHVIGA